MLSAKDAIARSIAQDEIVTLDNVPGLYESLLVECDACATFGGDEETDDILEFWGTDDGREWRVHLRGSAA